MAAAHRAASTKTQINFAIKLGAVVLVALMVLWMCIREPVRTLLMNHPRFEAVQTVTMPLPCGPLAAGDFNGDGLDDLVINLNPQHGPQPVVWLSAGGRFDPQRAWVLPDSLLFYSMAAGDLDGDGLAELVATSPSNTARALMVWQNLGDGRLELVRFEAPLQRIDLADDDGDGDLDLIGLTRNFGEIQIYPNEGGRFAQEPTVADDINDTSIRGFAVAQLDDGGVDVAMLAHNLQGGRVRIFRNGGLVPDPTAHFNLPPKWVTGESLSYETPSYDLADMNGNGRADLVLIDSNEVRVLLSLGGAEFIPSKRRVPSPPASQVVTGDFDGDGARDMVTVVPDGSALTVLLARP